MSPIESGHIGKIFHPPSDFPWNFRGYIPKPQSTTFCSGRPKTRVLVTINLTRFFMIPSWRSLNPLQGSLNHPKKVTLNHQVGHFFMIPWGVFFICSPPGKTTPTSPHSKNLQGTTVEESTLTLQWPATSWESKSIRNRREVVGSWIPQFFWGGGGGWVDAFFWFEFSSWWLVSTPLKNMIVVIVKLDHFLKWGWT